MMTISHRKDSSSCSDGRNRCAAALSVISRWRFSGSGGAAAWPWRLHPDAETPLRACHRVAEHAEWEKFADIRQTYPSADQVGKFTVFNIGGNKDRLVVAIHFDRGKVYVRNVLTHEDFDEGTWKKD
jgi:mRNA interferase HigB